MKKYYNITITLHEKLAPIIFALHTDEKYGRHISQSTFTRCNISVQDGDINAFRAAAYYYVADHIINQHFKQLSENPNSDTMLTQILKIVDEYGSNYYESEDDRAYCLISQGLETQDRMLIRKGLFRAIVHIFSEFMTFCFDHKGSSNAGLPDIMEFDHTSYAKHLASLGEKDGYTMQISINDPQGDLIEEFYECTVYTHPYIGEMMLLDADVSKDIDFYAGLFDTMQVKAATLLLNQHAILKSYDNDETPLERFWIMALEEGEIDEEEYDEIMSDINNLIHIDRIYEIIDNYGLVVLEDFGRDMISCKDDPSTVHYED